MQSYGRRALAPTRLLALGAVLAGLVAGSLVAPPGARSAAVEVGYRDFSYSTSITAPTGQKPESKLWYADGTWWGALWNNTVRRLEIHRFNQATQATNAWTRDRHDHRQPPQRRGRHPLGRQQALRADPHEGHRHHGHRPRPEVPAVRLQHDHQEVHPRGVQDGGEQEGRGRGAGQGQHRQAVGHLHHREHRRRPRGPRRPLHHQRHHLDRAVRAAGLRRRTTSAWTTSPPWWPTRTPSTGTRRIGVLWSNESAGTANGLYFASHVDGAGDTSASWAGRGCAPPRSAPMTTSTSSRSTPTPPATSTPRSRRARTTPPPPTPADPLIVVYRLNLNGTWTHTTAWHGQGRRHPGDHPARLDQPPRPTCSAPARAAAAAPSTPRRPRWARSPSPPASAPRSSRARQDPKINNATSTKQTVNSTTGLLVLAGDDSTRFYVHNFLTIRGGDTTAPTVTTVSPSDKATGQGVTANVTATFSEAMDPASVNTSTFTLSEGTGTAPLAGAVTLDVAGTTATLNPTANLKAGTSVHRPHQRSQGPRRQHRRREELDLHHRGRLDDHRHAPGDGRHLRQRCQPEHQYGTATTVWVDNSPVDTGYLKFTSPPTPGAPSPPPR